MRLWFGAEHGPEDPGPEDIRDVSADLRRIAEEEGIPGEEYVERLHERAFEAAREDVEEAENSVEARLRRKLHLADGLRSCMDRLGERLSDTDDEGVEALVRDLGSEQGRVYAEVEGLAEGLAPNLSALAGPGLAARLIDLAGGLEELARMPASTVQVLGAEKALFAHLSGKAPPPKHGVIYGHPDVHEAGDARGRLARSLASKLAIAARVDAYGGRDESGRLLDEWKERLREVEP